MRIVASTGKDEVACIYIAELSRGRKIEFVESVQPPLPRERKWVLLISTLFGCPIRCQMCDAGGHYQGKLSSDEILAQIDYLVAKRFPDKRIPCTQFKIQFARIGEPSLNPHVLQVLEQLPDQYDAPGLMPSISTIAPAGTQPFFEQLLEIKRRRYSNGHFQFQFSLHTTDEKVRDQIIPVKKWGFSEIAEYGERFYCPGDRKITLNFALAHGSPIEASVMLSYFHPDKFLVKITPINPTYQAQKNNLISYIDPCQDANGYPIVDELRAAGYDVIVSIGEVEENLIGSNCGQYLSKHLASSNRIQDGYTYPIQVFE